MTIYDKIKDWLNDVKKDLIVNYDRIGLRASGNWVNELEDRITETSKGYNATLLGARYTGVLETGRKPNTKQDKDSLRAWVGWAGSTILKDWVQRKGTSVNPFAAAYKIAREGIKVPNQYNTGGLVSDVITDSRIQKLTEGVSNVLIGEIKSDVIKQFKNGNN